MEDSTTAKIDLSNNEKSTKIIGDKRNKFYLFPKKALVEREHLPKFSGLINAEGAILDVAFWDNKSKSGISFYGGVVKNLNGVKNRICMFSSKLQGPKKPAFFGKFYYDGVFYKFFLWEQSSAKCECYYSGIIKVDISPKQS